MINKPLIKLINNAHYIAYFICVIIGLRVFVQQTFQNEIWLGGDEWEYQSIAVNFHYGYGFPISGAVLDSTKYHFFIEQADNGGISWEKFYNSPSTLNAYRNPIYPAFIAIVYACFGVSPAALFKIQFLLLVLFGSLFPLLGHKLSGRIGLFLSILAYMAFLQTSKHHAFSAMSEALIICYVIALITFYTYFDINKSKQHAVVWGVLLAFGILLKNYFIPISFFYILKIVYHAYITNQNSKSLALVFLLAFLFPILTWSTFINFEYAKHGKWDHLIILTTQGNDVLFASNNEYSTDGDWHPEWQQSKSSFYKTDDRLIFIESTKPLFFYITNPELFLITLKNKLVRGQLATIPQVLWYITLVFCIAYMFFSRKKSTKAIITVLLSILFLGLVFLKQDIMFIFCRLQSFLYEHTYSSLILFSLYFLFLGMAAKYLSKVYNSKIDIHFEMILNFLVLNVIFYGSPRIVSVIDVSYLLLSILVIGDMVRNLNYAQALKPTIGGKVGD